MEGLRIGIGRDFHVLQSGKTFVLGGVVIDAPFGPIAHSDGDCFLHALMDSLLGALGLPNIGQLFPDTAAINGGRSSLEMLSSVMEKVRTKNYCIQNVDAVIQLERPKISCYFTEMREKLAPILGIGKDYIGIKATTSEGVGVVGHSEAIEVICICLLRHF